MKPKNIFNSITTNIEEKKSKKIINDLLVGKKDDFSEFANTYRIITENGFSVKTTKLTAKSNLKIRQELNLNDLEYLLFAITMSTGTISVNKLSDIIKENSLNGLISAFKVMFNLYHKNIFAVMPGESGIQFKLTTEIIDFLHSRKEFKGVDDKSLKRVIFDIDSIANLYNAPMPAMAELGEYNILIIIDKYAEKHEYCALLKRTFEYCIKNSMLDYKFLFYMIGHLVINSLEYPNIEKNDSLVDSFASVNMHHESIINKIFKGDEKHYFFKEKIFDSSIDESGKADKNSIELHANFKRKYIKGIIKEKSHEDVIRSVNITKKEMFFNSSNKEKIDELTDMLSVRSFNNIKKRLSKKGTRTGFIILFSGYPGSGKTELTLQLAKKTGRDIIKVDMSSLRSKWWGEDEKNVKNIFKNYEAIRQESKIEPILLLNEADAIIGKRLNVGGNNGAIISSINATQNIILDAFENFEGILIATTNLTDNFDSAFERRFLYKIDFEKPNLETRTKILMSILKISEDDAKTVAKDFELTGGNIENIYRKMSTRQVLYGEDFNLNRILEYCKDEKIQKENKVGFNVL